MAGIGYFGSVLLDSTFGWTVNWAVLSVVAVVLVGFLGYREIDIAARVLVFLLAAEVAMVVILDVAIVFEKGADAFPLSIFSPHNVVNSGSLGLGLMFALLSLMGFESAALYGEETRDPRKTVPRATYLSVTVISVFYFQSSWIAVGAIGPDHVEAVASEQLVTTFFNLSDTYASSTLTTVLEFTYLTSLLASLLALHNASDRYMFVAPERPTRPNLLSPEQSSGPRRVLPRANSQPAIKQEVPSSHISSSKVPRGSPRAVTGDRPQI